MDEERLEAGGERCLARAFLAEKVKYGEMACAPEDYVTEQAREKVAQGHPCVVTEHVGKF